MRLTARDWVPVGPARHLLAEGPHWRPDTGTLAYVDLPARTIHTGTGLLELPRRVSFAIPTRTGWVAGQETEIAVLDGDRITRTLQLPGLTSPAVLNDAKCDPERNLWVGSYDPSGNRAGALYRLGPGGTQVIVTGAGASNGLACTAEGSTVLWIDTPTRQIHALTLDGWSGPLRSRRVWCDLRHEPGLPDGMALDAEGHAWVALFGGGRVLRIDPVGRIVGRFPTPVTHPTSLAFGGSDLRTLYLTTSRHRLTAAEVVAQPLAGAVLAAVPGVPGLPVASADAHKLP